MKPKIVTLPGLGRFAIVPDRGEALSYPGGLGFFSRLQVAHIREGEIIRSDDHGSGLVTNLGAEDVAKAFVNTFELETYNYHDSGTGTTAAAVTDTDLQTVAGPTTRATGTQSIPSVRVYRSVGAIAYTATATIAEWAIFQQAARGGTSRMFDRRILSATYGVVNGDTLQFTWDLTVAAGG